MNIRQLVAHRLWMNLKDWRWIFIFSGYGIQLHLGNLIYYTKYHWEIPVSREIMTQILPAKLEKTRVTIVNSIKQRQNKYEMWGSWWSFTEKLLYKNIYSTGQNSTTTFYVYKFITLHYKKQNILFRNILLSRKAIKKKICRHNINNGYGRWNSKYHENRNKMRTT